MMRSLFSGVAGLKTHQTRMDVVGHNIANVNTVGYKYQSMQFAEMLYQTTSSGSGPDAKTGLGGTNPRQIGLGVKTAAITTAITKAGSMETTNNPFDICITGESFFIVNNGLDNMFTRDGSFNVDAAGNLVMSSTGYNVMGWQVDPTTNDIKEDTVSALRILSEANMTYPPEATTEAYVSGIIDKNDTNVNSDDGKMMNLNFYDDRGYKYTARLAVKSTGTQGVYSVELDSLLDATTNEDVTAKFGASLGGSQTNVAYADPKTPALAQGTYAGNTITDGTIVYNLTATGVTATDNGVAMDNAVAQDKLAGLYGFDSWSELINQYYDVKDPATGASAAGYPKKIDGNLTDFADHVAAGDTQIIARDFTGVLANYSTGNGKFIGLGAAGGSPDIVATTLQFDEALAPNFKTLNVDFSTTSNVNNEGTSTVQATSGSLSGLNAGRKLGEMTGVTIQDDGKIYATYDNGQTRLLGQIAVANFANAAGLKKNGDNLYSATQNSGEFNGIGSNIKADGGYMTTGVLEMSNVDLSSELTGMIITQRGFQANSRIITVSDTMLEELINLKR